MVRPGLNCFAQLVGVAWGDGGNGERRREKRCGEKRVVEVAGSVRLLWAVKVRQARPTFCTWRGQDVHGMQVADGFWGGKE